MFEFPQKIKINSLTAIPIKTGSLKQMAHPPEPLYKPPTAEERQAQIDYQNSIPQTTVIEKDGKILAVIGENGWRRTFDRNAADLFDHTHRLTDEKFIDTLKEKYGGSLTIHEASKNDAPTWKEIRELVYGPPRIDYYA